MLGASECGSPGDFGDLGASISEAALCGCPQFTEDAMLTAGAEEFDNLDADEDGIVEANELRELCAWACESSVFWVL